MKKFACSSSINDGKLILKQKKKKKTCAGHSSETLTVRWLEKEIFPFSPTLAKRNDNKKISPVVCCKKECPYIAKLPRLTKWETSRYYVTIVYVKSFLHRHCFCNSPRCCSVAPIDGCCSPLFGGFNCSRENQKLGWIWRPSRECMHG